MAANCTNSDTVVITNAKSLQICSRIHHGSFYRKTTVAGMCSSHSMRKSDSHSFDENRFCTSSSAITCINIHVHDKDPVVHVMIIHRSNHVLDF